MNMSKLGISLSTTHMYLLFGIAIFFLALIGMQFYNKQLENLANQDGGDDEEEEEDEKLEGLTNEDGDEEEEDEEGFDGQEDEEEEDE